MQARANITDEVKQRMEALHKQGFSSRAIAKEIDCSPSSVAKSIALTPRDPIVHLKYTHGPISKKVMAKSVAFTKNTQVVTPTVIKVTSIPFTPPDYAPFCNSTQTAPYVGTELQYRR